MSLSRRAQGGPTADGYRGIWYYNQPSGDEYVYKYSGGLGTYCAKHIPLAYYASEVNKTFFCYGGTVPGGQRLLEMVSYYDHDTGTVPRPTVLVDKATDDAHDNPVLMLDRDGVVWVFASSHGTARPSYVFKSAEPYAIDSFEMVVETNFSYPQPWFLDECGFCFLHTRYVEGKRYLHWMTSEDGISWSAPQPLARIARGHYQVSWARGNRVGTAFNVHPDPGGLNYRTNLYYLETSDWGRTWRNARGEVMPTPLEAFGNAALVHDYAAEGQLVYLKDLNYDADGNPVVLYVRSRGYQSGPENGPRRWTTARWTGEGWDIQGTIESDSNYDTGCLHVEEGGVWRVIGPTEPGPQRYNPGGEMAVWISCDRGQSWTRERQITRGSAYNHTYARRPVHAHPDFYAFWADGHAREPSESRLYFCDRSGARVWRLPTMMGGPFQEPEPVP
jgi:hypothetical protein